MEFIPRVFSLNVAVLRLLKWQNLKEKMNMVEQSVDVRLGNIRSGFGGTSFHTFRYSNHACAYNQYTG